ncbi:MAG TPA: Crp/Fnr family transcriptional regulator [Thermoleophilia bacterium]|nr:Crp/Fnr family transcriptional regulator [Thermoleophilia bacterium]
MDPASVIDDLRDAPLFAKLLDGQLAKLATIAQPQRLAGGHTVFLQGDFADAFFLLSEGAVKVYKTFRDGRSATLRHVVPGQTFAESVLYADTYPSSAEAMEDSHVYRFATSAFRNLILDEPEIGVVLLTTMAQLMVLLNQRIEELLLPVPARLARYLLELCAAQRSPTQCRLPIAKHELAARLGTVPETLSRALNRFVRGGLIAVENDTLVVLNRPALERLAQQ